MQFLSIYTPKAQSNGAPDPEHMAKMGALMDEMTKAGTLLATGGMTRAETGGIRAHYSNGVFTVEKGPIKDSQLMNASGWALLQAKSREELLAGVKRFLEAAGDGTTDIIQLMDMPPN